MSFASLRGSITRTFASRGIETLIQFTTAKPDSARELAKEAGQSCDTVIACGGDGTVHGAVQGLAGTTTILGVLPFGTANALARNLGLPMDPILALDQLLGFTARSIPIGQAETSFGKRWFTVIAGAGPDGRLLHEMNPAIKSLLGRRAYDVEAVRLFLTRRFPAFQVEYRLSDSREWRTQRAVSVTASRIRNLGGLFRGLTADSRLHHPHLLVHLLAGPAHLALPAWAALGKVGLAMTNPWLTTLAVEELRCLPLPSEQPVYAQLDGEAMGPLPFTLRIVPSALWLLMPRPRSEITTRTKPRPAPSSECLARTIHSVSSP